MAYVTPDSDVYLLKNVQLDPSYSDTIYFETLAMQTNYFLTKYTKHHFDDTTYQRVNLNKIQLEGKADNYYDYNYMMFRNTAYGNKWFYAFINKLDYINDNTFEVDYEIDVLQTWAFDYTLEPCMIERQTVYDDTIGSNLIAEPVDLGDLVCQDFATVVDFKAYDGVVAYTEGVPVN